MVKTDKFDIKNIKNFEAKYKERYYYLYAIYNDGKSKMFSPCYVLPKQKYRYIIDEPVRYLNEAISKKPINIDLLFPDNSYFPEYIKNNR